MGNFLTKFNRYAGENMSLIRKALTSATGVGEGLIPQSLEKEITNIVIALSPELAMIEKKKIAGKTHEFNRLTALPDPGGAMGEAGTTYESQSTFTRTSVPLKIIRRKGKVTMFLQDASAEYIDAVAAETENNILRHVYDLVNTIVWGNANVVTQNVTNDGTNNAFEFSGLDTLCVTNRNTTVSQVRYGTTVSDLSFLDDMIDANLTLGGDKHRKALLMSPNMLSKVSRLLTNVRLNQGLVGEMTKVNIGGGWRMDAYRDIPIIPTTALRPRGQMTTVSVSVAGSGTVTSNTYYIKVAPVTLYGEQLASAEATAVADGSHSVALTWTAYPGAYRYKIYITKGAVNTEALVQVISATAYDTTGSKTGNIAGYTFTAGDISVAGLSVPAAMAADIPLEQDTVGGHDVPEVVALWDLDPIQGLGDLIYTNTGGSNFDGLVTFEPLAKTDDFIQFLVKSYCAIKPAWEATSVWYRGLRTK